MRFLKRKNTPVKEEVHPKKLKYENNYNYNYYNFDYRIKNSFSLKEKILTPTPFKDQQVQAGGVKSISYQDNKENNEYFKYNSSNINKQTQLRQPYVPLIQKSKPPEKDYTSKYPVNFSKSKIENNRPYSVDSYNFYNKNPPQNNVNIYKNTFEPQRNFVLSKATLFSNKMNKNENRILPNDYFYNNGYKIINADEFIGKTNLELFNDISQKYVQNNLNLGK
jgi:hypothetical protein